jgi:hypothetical protein
MSRLNEEFVRIEAISYLSDHYTQKHNLQKISVRKEASVTYRGKKGRADGLCPGPGKADNSLVW